jgi:predicted nuclease of predicted toxin-antitoxin system
MLRLLSDENFNGDIIRGLLLRHPDLDLIRVQDVGLEAAGDQTILEWAAANNRILLTHDRATMPDFAYTRVTAGQPMPGVFVLHDRLAIGQAIDALLLVETCSERNLPEGLVSPRLHRCIAIGGNLQRTGRVGRFSGISAFVSEAGFPRKLVQSWCQVLQYHFLILTTPRS